MPALIVCLIITGGFIYLVSCGDRPSKTEALKYYEEIYKTAIITKVQERNLRDELDRYFNKYVKHNTGKSDSMWQERLYEMNEKLIDDLYDSVDFIKELPNFQYKKDLRVEVLKVLEKQIAIQEDGVPLIIEIYADGMMTKEEAEKGLEVQREFEDMKKAYKNWKAIRKEFCYDFDITYEDIEAFAVEYDPNYEEN